MTRKEAIMMQLEALARVRREKETYKAALVIVIGGFALALALGAVM